jgi:serine/threonine protein kinase
MGEVFLARKVGPEGFAQHVVVKRMLPHLLERSEFVEMFFAEARIASRLSHERIASVVDAGESNGETFLVIEYVPGVTLSRLLDRATEAGRIVAPEILCALAAQAADGLAYAHRASDHDGSPLHLVHRDINPANLLVRWDGVLKIVDLGIAKSVLSKEKTQTGMLKGKFLYMSPEQSEGAEVTGTSDLFSLGIVLYEALTGHHPFDRKALARTLAAIQETPLPDLEDPELAALNPVLQRAMAKQPADRYPEAAAFAAALRQAMPCTDLSPLRTLMSEVFIEERRLEQQLLAEQDPEVLRELHDSMHPQRPLATGIDKVEGWTGFFGAHGSGAELDAATVSYGVNSPPAIDLPKPQVTQAELEQPSTPFGAGRPTSPVGTPRNPRGPNVRAPIPTEVRRAPMRLWWVAAGVSLVMIGLTFWATQVVDSPEPAPPVVVATGRADAGRRADTGVRAANDGGRRASPDAAAAPHRAPALRLVVRGASGVVPNGAADLPRSGSINLTRGALTVRGRFERRGSRRLTLHLAVSPWAVLYPPGSGTLRSPPERTFEVVLGEPLTLGVAAPGTPRFDLTFALEPR